jgi:hypothetical protein
LAARSTGAVPPNLALLGTKDFSRNRPQLFASPNVFLSGRALDAMRKTSRRSLRAIDARKPAVADA